MRRLIVNMAAGLGLLVGLAHNAGLVPGATALARRRVSGNRRAEKAPDRRLIARRHRRSNRNRKNLLKADSFTRASSWLARSDFEVLQIAPTQIQHDSDVCAEYGI
jgi:hypothetical protein